MPTTMGMIVLLIAVQLLFGRKRCWLPDFLMKRSVPPEKLEKLSIDCGRWRVLSIAGCGPDCLFFSYGVGLGIVAIAYIAIAAVMPVAKIVPFSATSAGAILTILGLSLITKDGFMALPAQSIPVR